MPLIDPEKINVVSKRVDDRCGQFEHTASITITSMLSSDDDEQCKEFARLRAKIDLWNDLYGDISKQIAKIQLAAEKAAAFLDPNHFHIVADLKTTTEELFKLVQYPNRDEALNKLRRRNHPSTHPMEAFYLKTYDNPR